MQIYILDQDGKVKGTLSSDAKTHKATPFFDDEYTMDLQTGAETFTFSTLTKTRQAQNLVVGNYIAFRYKEEYKLFQISEAIDEHNSDFITTVYCEMAGIELISEPLRPREYPSASLKQFVTSVLSDTDWKVGSIDSRLTSVHTIDLTSYGTVYSTLQKYVTENYGGELAFRVEYNKGKVVGKYVDVYAERGTFNGFRFSYDMNLDNVKRTVDSSELATALIGVGKDNLTFKSVSSSDKPLNQDWIGDEESYKRWNKNGNHIFGVFECDTESEGELLKLTREELQKRKHPKITYELGINLFGRDDLGIGDTVYVVDNEFIPALHLSARVNQLKISFTDNNKNECVLANFKEVQSRITDEMRQLASLIDSKFPIGTEQIKDSAITSDKIGQNAVNGNHVQHDTLIADHIKANQIKTEHLEADSITAEKIKANEIKTDHLEANSVTTDKLDANVVTSDKIQAGSIVGDHLTSNLIEATHIKADQIEAGHIKSDSIETNHLKANSINTDKLQANSITTEKLQANSISADKLQANSITADKVQANAIEGTHIKGDSIVGNHIQSEVIDTKHLKAEIIEGTHIKGDTIEGEHIKGETIEGTHIKGETIEGTHIKGETIEGTHIKGESITGNHIQSNSINTGHLNANTITGNHIQSNTISSNHIQANSIGTDKLQANSISTDKLQANSIDTKHLKSEIIEAGHIKSDTITADQIKGETITGNEIKGNTITGNHIQSGTISSSHIQANAIGSNQIQTGALTSDKMVIANGFIKDAMIDNINASKIKAGTIDTSKVTIESSNGNIVIADATQQFKDKYGNVRVQIGEDAQGDFTFQILDETGEGVLIDHNGIKEKAIANGLIKNEMIGNGEIDGSKVDIDSLVTKLNNDGTKTILGSKVQIDTTGQTLNVVFKELNDKIDNIEVEDNSERFEALETAISVEQGRINTLISNTTIEKDGTTTTLKDAHSKLEQTVNGLNSTVSATTTKIEGLESSVSHAESLIKQNADEIALKVDVNGVKSAIALDESGVKIGGEHIDLEGQVTISSLDSNLSEVFGEEYGSTVIDGGKIKTGSITAEKVDVKNLTVKDDAENITLHISEEGTVSMSGDLSSYDYNEVNNTGWSLSREGNATLNNATVRGNVILPSAGITNHGESLRTNYLPLTDFTKNQSQHYKTYYKNGLFGITYNTTEGYIRVYSKNLDVSDGNNGLGTPRLAFPLVAGKTYTLSYDASSFGHLEKLDYVYIISNDGTGNIQFPQSTENIGAYGEWNRVSHTMTINKDIESPSLLIGFKDGVVTLNNTNKGFLIKNIKFEEGYEASEYTPYEVGEQVRFWAGTEYENRNKAPFKVLQDGSIHATKGHFGGTFTGRLEIGDIVLEDTDKGYLLMNDNSGNKVIHIGEEEVYFKPTSTFGDIDSNFFVDKTEATVKNKTFSVVKSSGGIQTNVLKVNPNSSSFLELNGTHTLKTNNSTLEIIGNHTQFSNDVTIVGDLSSDNMVVGEMRMERKNESGNKGVDFIFI